MGRRGSGNLLIGWPMGCRSRRNRFQGASCCASDKIMSETSAFRYVQAEDHQPVKVVHVLALWVSFDPARTFRFCSTTSTTAKQEQLIRVLCSHPSKESTSSIPARLGLLCLLFPPFPHFPDIGLPLPCWSRIINGRCSYTSVNTPNSIRWSTSYATRYWRLGRRVG